MHNIKRSDELTNILSQLFYLSFHQDSHQFFVKFQLLGPFIKNIYLLVKTIALIDFINVFLHEVVVIAFDKQLFNDAERNVNVLSLN